MEATSGVRIPGTAYPGTGLQVEKCFADSSASFASNYGAYTQGTAGEPGETKKQQTGGWRSCDGAVNGESTMRGGMSRVEQTREERKEAFRCGTCLQNSGSQADHRSQSCKLGLHTLPLNLPDLVHVSHADSTLESHSRSPLCTFIRSLSKEPSFPCPFSSSAKGDRGPCLEPVYSCCNVIVTRYCKKPQIFGKQSWSTLFSPCCFSSPCLTRSGVKGNLCHRWLGLLQTRHISSKTGPSLSLLSLSRTPPITSGLLARRHWSSSS